MVVTGAARRRLSTALVVVVAKVEIIPAHHRWPYLGIDRKSKMNNMKPQEQFVAKDYLDGDKV